MDLLIIGIISIIIGIISVLILDTYSKMDWIVRILLVLIISLIPYVVIVAIYVGITKPNTTEATRETQKVQDNVIVTDTVVKNKNVIVPKKDSTYKKIDDSWTKIEF